MRRILIVDENKYLLDGLTMQLRVKLRNCLVMTAENGVKALKMLEAGPVDILLTDLQLRGIDGYELMKRAKRLHPHLPMYMMTSDDQSSIERRVRSLGARGCIFKPVSFDKIASFIAQELDIDIKQTQRHRLVV